MSVEVSVVVLTVAGLPHLQSCLDHLARSRVAPYEVIVVDGFPDGRLAVTLAREHPHVRVVRNPSGARARREARRIGADVACGEVIAYLDDDAAPDDEWLGTVIEHYTDPSVAGVGGRLVSRDPTRRVKGELVGRVLADGRLVANFRVDPGRPVTVHHLSGVNMSFRREIVTGLDLVEREYPGTGAWEDADLCWRARRRGGQLIFDPRAVVYYEPGRPRTGGTRRAPTTYHYGVRNNLALLIRHGMGLSIPVWFARATLRVQVDHLREAVRFLRGPRRSAGTVGWIQGIAGSLAVIGGEVSGIPLGALDGLLARRAERRGRQSIGQRA